MVTSAPSAARRRAIAAPMPLAPPVTSAFLPSSLMGKAAYSGRPVACSPVAEPIPIIGGTGALGYGLAVRWARVGQAIVIGSRKAARAEEAAERVRSKVEGADVEGLQNAEAATRGPIVFLTVPFRAQSETLTNLKDALSEGQLLVDCTVPTAAAVSGRASRTLGVWQGSAAQQAEEMVPNGVTVISALHTVSSKRLAEGDPLDEDILVCGDRKADKARVARLIEQIDGLRAVNAGALEMARIVETLTPMLISINARYKTAAGIRITDLPEGDPWA
jgi:8-hydroxy-5-deazaflavin:NADPH oxidoreductase